MSQPIEKEAVDALRRIADHAEMGLRRVNPARIPLDGEAEIRDRKLSEIAADVALVRAALAGAAHVDPVADASAASRSGAPAARPVDPRLAGSAPAGAAPGEQPDPYRPLRPIEGDDSDPSAWSADDPTVFGERP